MLSCEFRRNSAPIAGANLSSYTPIGSDDLTNLTVAVAALLDGASVIAESAALAVTHVAPVAPGNLVDVTFASGSGNKSIDSPSDFTGAGISYSVSAPGIPGVSIDAATGVVNIPTASSANGTITVTGTNRGGSASTSFNATVETTGTPATIPTVLTNVIDFGDGDTISLSEAREVLQYADGSFSVISMGGDVVITADSPASVAQPGDGYVANGMMHTNDIRIIEDTSTIDQAWDKTMGDQPKLIKPTFSTGYSAALNKAPSRTGANLVMAPSGGTGGVVKVKRRAILPTSNAKYENAAVLEKARSCMRSLRRRRSEVSDRQSWASTWA